MVSDGGHLTNLPDPSRDDWSVHSDILLARECEAEIANARTFPVDVEAGVEALRRGGFAEWAFGMVRAHAELLAGGAATNVIVLDDYRRVK